MPGSHEYEPASTQDPLADDSDSDIDLDVHELGPRLNGGHGQPGGDRAGNAAPPPSSEIPLRTMRRAPGRRAKKFEGQGETGKMDGEDARPASQEGGSLDGQLVGDATPLLHPDQDGGATASANGGMFSRGRLSPFGPRRSGYRNLADPASDASTSGEKASSRSVQIGQPSSRRFPSNAISNAKYTPWSFLPRTLYNEFSFFINLYFLIVALSQLIPDLRVGVLWTYMAPLAFVLAVTLGKEAYDDVERRKRDAEANREPFTSLRFYDPNEIHATKRRKKLGTRSRKTNASGVRRLEAIEEEEENTGGVQVEEVRIKAKEIKVGDILVLGKDDRVPADVVILKSVPAEQAVAAASKEIPAPSQEPDLLFDQNNDERTAPQAPEAQAQVAGPPEAPDGGGAGESFIRTDQLDGETDWKLRIASPLTQSLNAADFTRVTIIAGKPSKKVNEFAGRIELRPKDHVSGQVNESTEESGGSRPVASSLSLDNTAWANTVLASNATVMAVVIYTGPQTRAALSTAPSRSKTGLLEYEINNLTKILCLLTATLSGVLVGLQAYEKNLTLPWYVSVCRFLILFSSIIPISLRLNLDLGKTVYAYFVHHDKEIEGAIVRTSTIPEDLGRIEYLLSDKTGTLTQNGKSN